MTPNRSPFPLTIDSGRPWRLRFAGLFIGMIAFSGSHANEKLVPDSPAVPVVVAAADTVAAPSKAKEARMWMTVGERRFAVSFADTDGLTNSTHFSPVPFAFRLEGLRPFVLEMFEPGGPAARAEFEDWFAKADWHRALRNDYVAWAMGRPCVVRPR